MNLIATKEEIIEIALFNEVQIDPNLLTDYFINNSQLRWLKPILTIDFYYKVTANQDDYTLLINGGNWTNSRSKERNLTGLKAALSYLCICDLAKHLKVQINELGLAVISPDDQTTTPAENYDIADLRRKFYSDGAKLADEVTEYLDDQTTTLFDDYTTCDNIRNTFRNIGGIYL